MNSKIRGAALAAALLLLLSGCGQTAEETVTETEAETSEAEEAQEEEAAEEETEEASESEEAEEEDTAEITGLVIDPDTLTEEPTMIDWTQDGVEMQIIALLDSNGDVQIAYNTCQVCAGSPYAYFEYEDGVLVCQNCGNKFSLSSVGKTSGGCNPMPATGETTDDGLIVISEEVLADASASFINWKAFS